MYYNIICDVVCKLNKYTADTSWRAQFKHQIPPPDLSKPMNSTPKVILEITTSRDPDPSLLAARLPQFKHLSKGISCLNGRIWKDRLRTSQNHFAVLLQSCCTYKNNFSSGGVTAVKVVCHTLSSPTLYLVITFLGDWCTNLRHDNQ